MYNSILIIGRTTDKPTLKKFDNGTCVSKVTIAVNRPFKNSDGEYDTDFINCTIWNNQATAANEFCKKGSLIGVRGYVTNKDDTVAITTEEGEILKKNIKVLEINADRVFFLKL